MKVLLKLKSLRICDALIYSLEWKQKTRPSFGNSETFGKISLFYLLRRYQIFRHWYQRGLTPHLQNFANAKANTKANISLNANCEGFVEEKATTNQKVFNVNSLMP